MLHCSNRTVIKASGICRSPIGKLKELSSMSSTFYLCTTGDTWSDRSALSIANGVSLPIPAGLEDIGDLSYIGDQVCYYSRYWGYTLSDALWFLYNPKTNSDPSPQPLRIITCLTSQGTIPGKNNFSTMDILALPAPIKLPQRNTVGEGCGHH